MNDIYLGPWERWRGWNYQTDKVEKWFRYYYGGNHNGIAAVEVSGWYVGTYHEGYRVYIADNSPISGSEFATIEAAMEACDKVLIELGYHLLTPNQAQVFDLLT